MQELVREYLNELGRKQRKRRRIGAIVAAFVIIVAGGVIWSLIQSGIAMTGEAKCGIEEHTHGEECYTNVPVCGQEESEGHKHTEDCYKTVQSLVCGQEESEEHTHTEDCYQTENVLACGQEESEGHVHTDACYEKQLTCEKEEHIHTDACYIDPDADVEDASLWDAQYEDVQWEEAWGANLVTAAAKQIGYKESTKNYTIAEDGSHKGYSRYGQFAGDVYADWDAAFVNFCIHYAGLEELQIFPNEVTAEQWHEKYVTAEEGKNKVYMTTPEGYEPEAGDIIFLKKDNEETETQMGIVSSYDKEKNEIKVIEGNSGNEVKENKYSLDDSHISEYLMVTEMEKAYKNIPDVSGEEKAGEAADETEVKEDAQQEPENKTEEDEQQADGKEAGEDPQAEEENWAYEESYDTDKVIIQVKAGEGVVPEGAELSVTPIEKQEVTDEMSRKETKEAEAVNEQYELTEKKLQEESEKKGETLEGFLAYDISFLVDGEEVEPSGDVKVTMDFKEAVKPEGVSENAAIVVNHLKEDKSAEDGVVVEDLTEKEDTTIATAEADASVEKVELVADSFSTFTISWTSETVGNISIGNVKFVDEQGGELNVENANIVLENKTTTNLKEKYNKALANQGYEVVQIMMIIPSVQEYGKYDEYEFDSLKTNDTEFELYQDGKPEPTYSSNVMVLSSGSGYYIQVKCKSKGGTWLAIEDTVAVDGLITVTGQYPTENVRFVWSKQVNDGEFEVLSPVRYGDETTISADGKSLNVPLDKGGLTKTRTKVIYKVELQSEDGTILDKKEYSVPYYSEVVNGSFEEPKYNNHNTIHQPSHEAVPGWWTTATSEKAPWGIEIVPSDENNYVLGGTIGYGDSVIKPDDGRQFAEINAEGDGALYQDVLTYKNIPLTYYFSHRGRINSMTGGIDSMYVVIIPKELAENGLDGNGDPIDTNTEVTALMQKATQDPEFKEKNNVYVQPYTYSGKWSSPDQWDHHSDTYTPTGCMTRFFFVSDQRNMPSYGNFIDNVSFTQDVPEATDGRFNLRVEKTVTGLSEEQFLALKENLVFDVAVKDSSDNYVQDANSELLTGGNVRLNASEMAYYLGANDSFVLYKDYLGNNIQGIYTVSVTERESTAEVTDYTNAPTYQTIVTSNGVEGEPKNTNTTAVSEEESVTVKYTNAYTPKDTKPEAEKKISVIKIWKDFENYDTRKGLSIRLDLSGTYKDENGKSCSVTEEELEKWGIESKIINGSEKKPWQDEWTKVPVYYKNNENQPITWKVKETLTGDNSNLYEAKEYTISRGGQPQLAQKETVNYEADEEHKITNSLKADAIHWSMVKYSTSNNNTEDRLEGAKFELRKDSLQGTVAATGDSIEDGIISWKQTDGKEGLSGLTGDYVIVETQAPEGFTLSSGDGKNSWDVKLVNGIPSIPKTYGNIQTNGPENGNLVIYIGNTALYSLPESGGSGIYWYMFGGILLMAGAALIAYKKRCREVLKG